MPSRPSARPTLRSRTDGVRHAMNMRDGRVQRPANGAKHGESGWRQRVGPANVRFLRTIGRRARSGMSCWQTSRCLGQLRRISAGPRPWPHSSRLRRTRYFSPNRRLRRSSSSAFWKRRACRSTRCGSPVSPPSLGRPHRNPIRCYRCRGNASAMYRARPRHASLPMRSR